MVTNSDRFRILKDVTIPFNPATSIANYFMATRIPIDFYIKTPNLISEYSADNGSISDFTTGAVYLVLKAGFTSTTENNIFSELNVRCRFTD